ncbi:hypothetical protein ACM25N_12240 [Roseovarius sp. C7]|uniref:hypothetical protein n=1 Tax=Roseovarius sp. C7 TaxID=3398643 RepID=UPI0039F6B768
MMGVFISRLNLLERLIFAVTAILFMNSDWRYDLAAAALFAILFFWGVWRSPTEEVPIKLNKNQKQGDTT